VKVERALVEVPASKKAEIPEKAVLK